jgi:pSer/pThr/pTyr-binding forkhead associated (FHA) protein
MVVQCPQCSSGHLLDEGDFEGLAQLELECSKCQTSFLVKAPQPDEAPGGAEAAGKPGPKETMTAIAARVKFPTGKRVSLVVMEGPRKGEIFRLSKPEVTIGRLTADVVLDDPEISSTHCALEVRGDLAILTDMGSTNGTFVGMEQIKRQALEHLSEFRIGETKLMYVISNAE